MITKNLMTEFFTKNYSASAEVKGIESMPKTSNTQFKDVLSNSLSKKAERSYDLREAEQIDRTSEIRNKNFEQGKQVKAFREITKNDSVQSQPKKVNEESEQVDEALAAVEDKETVKKQVVVNALAQLMGISTEELQNLLGSINAEAEDLTDMVKAEEVIDKLSALLALNAEQKQALSLAIQEINTQAESMINSDDNSEEMTLTALPKEKTESKQEWVRVEGVNIEVVEQKPVQAEFSDVISEMKSKISELAQKLAENPEDFKNAMSAEVKALIAKNLTTEAINTTALNDTTSVLEIADEGVNTQAAANQGNKADAEQENDSSSNSDKGAEVQVRLQANSTGVKVDTGAEQFNNLVTNSIQKNDMVAETAKLAKEVKTVKNEIMTQVIEKAKVVLTGDKSEMVMDLKPDSLGKLSLKVVTERGIVMAKFVAESQQVKEVLESNMQLLKDSLEKQGLSIQGFSVSVGQDSAREFRREQFLSKGTSSSSLKNDSDEGNGIAALNTLEEEQRQNPYTWSESSINVTA